MAGRWLKVTNREDYNSVFTGKIVTNFSAQKLCFTWCADGQTKYSEFTRLNAEEHNRLTPMLPPEVWYGLIATQETHANTGRYELKETKCIYY